MKINPAQYAAELKKKNGIIDAARIAENSYNNVSAVSGKVRVPSLPLEPMYRGHEADRSAGTKNLRDARKLFAFWQNVNGILQNEIAKSKGKKK